RAAVAQAFLRLCAARCPTPSFDAQRPGRTSRMGGRVVEGAGLENRKARKGLGGSNPSPSAIASCKRVHLLPALSCGGIGIAASAHVLAGRRPRNAGDRLKTRWLADNAAVSGSKSAFQIRQV